MVSVGISHMSVVNYGLASFQPPLISWRDRGTRWLSAIPEQGKLKLDLKLRLDGGAEIQ